MVVCWLQVEWGRWVSENFPSPAPEIFHGCALQLVVGRYHEGIFLCYCVSHTLQLLTLQLGIDGLIVFQHFPVNHAFHIPLDAKYELLFIQVVLCLMLQPCLSSFFFAYYVRVQSFSSAETILFSQSKQRLFKTCILHASMRRRRSKSVSLGWTHMSNLLTLLQVNGWHQTCQSVSVLSGVDQLWHRRTNSHC